MSEYIENIIKYNGNQNVIKNMVLASAIHDSRYKTNYCEELKKWVLENGYTL